jgi:hypothetical protein
VKPNEGFPATESPIGSDFADNRLTEIASWDDRLLGEQLR